MRADLQAIFAAGLARVDPYRMMMNHLRLEDDRLVVAFDGRREEFPLEGRRVLVLGAGKASAPMARAAEDILARLDVPSVTAHPVEFQTLDQWGGSQRGLLPVESTIMVAIPELDGATGAMV